MSGRSSENVLGQMLASMALAAAAARAQQMGGLLFLKAVVENDVTTVRELLRKDSDLVRDLSV